MIGECVATWLGDGAASIGCSHDFLLMTIYSVLPDEPPGPVTNYGFQLVQIPLRAILPEWEYMSLPFNEVNEWQLLLEDSRLRLNQVFEEAMRYNRKSVCSRSWRVLSFPSRILSGRLLPRDDPRNLVFVVESLNRHLVTLVASYRNTYYVDFDQIASGLGKQFIQDDTINSSSHGAFLSDFNSTARRGSPRSARSTERVLRYPCRCVQRCRLGRTPCYVPNRAGGRPGRAGDR